MIAPSLLALTAALSPVDAPLEFEQVAPGVWACDLGSPEAVSLLSVAGGEPKLAALGGLPEVEFPLADGAARGHASATRCGLRMPLARGEDVFGLGLDFHRVRQNGTIHELRVDHWGGRTGRTHAPVPMWISSEGYGVLIDSARYLEVYVGTSLRANADPAPDIRDRNTDPTWQAHPPSDSIDVHVPASGARVYVFGGPTPLHAVQRYVLFTGGGCLPPRWGLGFTHRTPTRYSAQQLLDEVAEFEARGFPLDFVGVEPGWHSHAYPCTFEWDEGRFPDPKGFVETLLERGVRTNLWANPYLHPDSDLAKELAPFAASHRVWNGVIVDYELPEARAAFADHLDAETISIGVSGFKIDEVDGFDRWLWPNTAEFPSGLDAEVVRQTYGLRVQRIVDDLYRARDRRTFGLARATNAGGSRLPFVIYNDHYSHREFITALVNSSFTGLLWTPEVRASKSAEEWLRRMQTVCFSPMAMLNAWADGTKPWTFEEVEDEVREVALLRMRLMPYLYTAFAKYHDEGVPPVRAMPLVEGWAEVGDDKTRRRHLADQFVVGDSLLVAPLFEGERERTVLLPAGRWYDFHTGELAGEGGLIEVEREDLQIPVFVRDGAIVPLGEPRLHAPAAGEVQAIEARHYGEVPGAYRLYHDDGETFAYERGERAWVELEVLRDESLGWIGIVPLEHEELRITYRWQTSHQ